MEHYMHEWPRKKDSSGILIAMISIIGVCVIAFSLMSISNYHGASYAFASTQWGETLINFVHWFWRIFTPALPG